MGHWINLSVEGESTRICLQDVWRLSLIDQINQEIRTLPSVSTRKVIVDGKLLREIDTAAALLLLERILGKLSSQTSHTFENFREEHLNIIRLVSDAYQPTSGSAHERQTSLLAKIGRETIGISKILRNLTSFIGNTFVEMGRTLVNPKLLRFKEFIIQLEQVGVNSIPIVCLVTFLIGIVIAYLFGIQTEKYGANIFLVDAVALAMCRELSPILVAIILAGRSGSAFTAQIGTMKINEEIDAMVTLGLSPMRVIVLPRVFALMVSIPLLVFVGDVLGIVGSMVIADLRLDITGVTFLQRLQAVLPLRAIYVGFIKAPVFALFIAVIGCQLGFAVEDNARSVGINTTATVVRSIVAVILLNAGFAILFVELGI